MSCAGGQRPAAASPRKAQRAAASQRWRPTPTCCRQGARHQRQKQQRTWGRRDHGAGAPQTCSRGAIGEGESETWRQGVVQGREGAHRPIGARISQQPTVHAPRERCATAAQGAAGCREGLRSWQQEGFSCPTHLATPTLRGSAAAAAEAAAAGVRRRRARVARAMHGPASRSALATACCQPPFARPRCGAWQVMGE